MPPTRASDTRALALLLDRGDSERCILELIKSQARADGLTDDVGRRKVEGVRRERTDKWDDATRGEWKDIRRWGLLFAGTSAVVVAYLVARLVTTSSVAQLGIAGCVAAIVGFVGGRLEEQRSSIGSAKKNSDPST